MRFPRFLRDNAAWLLAGYLLTFSSSYGQTFFISLFAGHIKGEFGLTDGQWGGLYTLATTASAIAMVWAGVLTDRYRARGLGTITLAGLALACLAMAAVPSPALLVVVIFALRFTGQGMSTHIAVVAMARWFSATRGKALATARLGYATGEAFLPLIFVALLAFLPWRSLWIVAALAALAAIPLLLALLQRERIPAEMSAGQDTTGLGGRHWTRAEVLRHPLFWAAVPLIVGPAAFGTALFFHQVHLVQVKGWALIDFVSLYPLYSGTSFVFMLISGWAVDQFGSARLMPWVLLPAACAFLTLGGAEGLGGGAVSLVLYAVTAGLMGTIPSAFWAEFFGTRHIGAIKALAAALMVFGSAIGPGLTGWLIDLGYPFPTQMFAIGLYFLVASALIWLGIRRYGRAVSAN